MWVACDAAKVSGFDRGEQLTWGVRNPFDSQRLFRVVRADGREMIELVLQPETADTLDVELMAFSGGSCIRTSAWVGMHPIRGETRVEVWTED